MLARVLELEILRGQRGVEEGPANNTGERVHEYQDSGSYPFTSAWCADFGGAWGHRLATGARRVKIKGEWQLRGGEIILGGPGNTASCASYLNWARSGRHVIYGKPAKADKMIFSDGSHFMTIDKVLRVLPGLLYTNTIEGNTSSYGALSRTPHNRDGVYSKRRIVRRSSVTIVRVPGEAKPIDPLAVAALNRLTPKPKPKPKPKPPAKPKPKPPAKTKGAIWALFQSMPWIPANQDRKK